MRMIKRLKLKKKIKTEAVYDLGGKWRAVIISLYDEQIEDNAAYLYIVHRDYERLEFIEGVALNDSYSLDDFLMYVECMNFEQYKKDYMAYEAIDEAFNRANDIHEGR